MSYKLFMIFGSLDVLRIKIILILVHLFPKQVSCSKLSFLLGYSKRARSIYRGVLPDLEKKGLITICRTQKNNYRVSVNYDNPFMFHLIKLTAKHGYKNTVELTKALNKSKGCKLFRELEVKK
ncbi:MAG: hypothetical protein ACTSP4_13540 [Candidatus Hodarchaeales archaeon]